MKRQVYIASAGYSGSTLLDMVLGMHKDVTSLGEVQLINEYARKDLLCTCGEPFGTCRFWRRITEEMKRTDGADFSMADFTMRVGQGRATIHRKLPQLVDFLVLFGWPKLWQRVSQVSSSLRAYESAVANTIKLFNTIARVEATPVIVDSTKYAVPMKLLYFSQEERFRVIHLVRDGRGVCLSYREQKRLGMEQAARRWRRFNWNIEAALRNVPQTQKLLLRYEDFCDDPAGKLLELTDFIGLDSPLEVRNVDKQNCHNINGNPMRFRRDEKSIVKSERWKSVLSRQELDVFEKVAGRENVKYGYA